MGFADFGNNFKFANFSGKHFFANKMDAVSNETPLCVESKNYKLFTICNNNISKTYPYQDK